MILSSGVHPGVAGSAATGFSGSHYDLAVEFDPETRIVAGTLSLDWLNTTGETQEALYFRLYPNAAYYGTGETVVSSVSLDGDRVEAGLWPDSTVLEIDLERGVAPGAGATIEMSFSTTIPDSSAASFGILGGDPDTGWWLADWYPILAGWEPGSGWYLVPPTAFGDPTFSDSATYDLSLVAPDDYEVMGSGRTVAVVEDGLTGKVTTGLVSGPGRDLTLSLLPASSHAVVTAAREVGGVELRVSLPPELAVPGLADSILAIAGDVMPVYERWLGEYPDANGLDITAVPLAGANGVSWNGIIWLDLERVAGDGRLSATEEASLRFVLVHELSHQWISGIVGSNNNDHGFMSEGLANVLSVLAIRELAGDEAAAQCFRDWIVAGYRGMVGGGSDGVADAPLADDTNVALRSQLIYGKAALGFEAIRQEIGEAAFLSALGLYAAEFRFRISEPADLLRAFEDASGSDLDALWSQWFQEQGTTLDDIDQVIDGFAQR